MGFNNREDFTAASHILSISFFFLVMNIQAESTIRPTKYYHISSSCKVLKYFKVKLWILKSMKVPEKEC